tara:strand:- start:177 stop:428 length:252 start_codon:yes stop_codon:yes gene_type:complete
MQTEKEEDTFGTQGTSRGADREIQRIIRIRTRDYLEAIADIIHVIEVHLAKTEMRRGEMINSCTRRKRTHLDFHLYPIPTYTT